MCTLMSFDKYILIFMGSDTRLGYFYCLRRFLRAPANLLPPHRQPDPYDQRPALSVLGRRITEEYVNIS